MGPHSYDPGFSATGVIWIAAIPEDGIEVEFDEGEASLHARNISVNDSFTIENSLGLAVPPLGVVPATIDSIEIEWHRPERRFQFSDPEFTYQGAFIENSAEIELRVTSSPGAGKHGFTFVSADEDKSRSAFAEIAQEHNGSFFKP